MTDLYGCFYNDQLIEGPKPLPKSIKTLSDETIVGFDRLLITDPNKIKENNWYIVDSKSINISYNPNFEEVVYSSWRLENDILMRDHTFLYHSFELALTKNFSILDKNRERFEVGGFIYDYYGTDVIILTDKESSQGKLTAAQICANNGTRSDTDVWKFFRADDKSVMVVQLSNTELNNICNFVFRQIQDAYNLTSQISWQMLGCGTTEVLKQKIESGEINLNPWGVI